MRTHSVTEQNDWATYRDHGDEDARGRLIERHFPLVRYFGRRMQSSAGSALSLDELVSAGTLGLMNAVEAYDPELGYQFSTFAAPRIRGAMLDELRRRDPAPRSVRVKERRLTDTENRLTLRLERLPRHEEVAEVLGLDPSTLWGWKEDVVRSRRVSLEEAASTGSGPGSLRLREVLSAEDYQDAEERVSVEQEVARLRHEIEQLDERERMVLYLHDFQEMKMREVAAILNVTESRISQIRTRALGRLRARMGDLREVAA